MIIENDDINSMERWCNGGMVKWQNCATDIEMVKLLNGVMV